MSPTVEVLPQAKQSHATPGWAYVLETAAPDPSRLLLPASGAGKKRQAARSAMEHMAAAAEGSSSSTADQQPGHYTPITPGFGHLDANTTTVGAAVPATPTAALLPAATATTKTLVVSKERLRFLNELARDGPGRADVEVPAGLTREMNQGLWKYPTEDNNNNNKTPTAAARKQTPNVKRILLSAKNWTHFAADEAVLRGDGGGNKHQRNKSQPQHDKSYSNNNKIAPPHGDDDDDNDDENSRHRRLLHIPYLPDAEPSDQVLAALVRAPPPSYAALAAAPSSLFTPPRRFCAMCGYWGRVKCIVCATYVCGIACRASHQAAEHPHR